MKLKTLSIFISLVALVTLNGCSSSSNNSSEADSDSLGNGLTLRLISTQQSFNDGSSTSTNFQYDEAGNLLGFEQGGFSLTYNIEPDGRIIDSVSSNDGVPAEATRLYFYDEAVGLRRIDNLASVENVGVIGVSVFQLYKFENNLATSLEFRIIPFEDITVNGQVEDSAGDVAVTTEFKYDGDRLIQELLGDRNEEGMVVDGQRDYSYNADGTLASTSRTGAITGTTVYTYEQGPCNHNWGNSTYRYFCVAVE